MYLYNTYVFPASLESKFVNRRRGSPDGHYQSSPEQTAQHSKVPSKCSNRRRHGITLWLMFTQLDLANIGAFIIRIGFWGPLYYNSNEEPPKTLF